MSTRRFNLFFNNSNIFLPNFINDRWMVNNVTASTTNLGSTRSFWLRQNSHFFNKK